MNIHKNARLTPRGREIMISRLERSEHPKDVAAAMGVSVNTLCKWRRRFQAEGKAGLQDRSSRPKTSPNKISGDIEVKVIALRRQRRAYDRIAALWHSISRQGRQPMSNGLQSGEWPNHG